MSAGASPQTLLESLQRSIRPPSWFQGAASRQEGNGGVQGSTRGGGRTGKGKGNGEWRGKGESWGNSALVVGGIDAPAS